MKFKSLLKIGLPLLGTTALAVSLPLALTSCSNSDEGPISFEQNLTKTTTVKKGQNFLELSVKANSKNQDKQLAYQWYVKEPAKAEGQSLVKLSDNEDKKDPLQGFKAIETSTNPTANESTLQIAYDLENIDNYEFVVAVWEVNKTNTFTDNKEEQSTPEYKFSDVTKISVNNSSSLTDVQTNVSNIQSLDISSLLTTTKDVVDANGNIIKTSDVFKKIATNLNLKPVEKAGDEFPTISSMKLTKKQPQNGKETFDLQVNLNSGYTWGVDVFKNGEEGLQTVRNTNKFKLDANQNLVIENLVSGITTPYGYLLTYLNYFANRSNANDLSATIQQIQAGLKGKTYSASSGNKENFKKMVTGLGYSEEQVDNVEVKLFSEKEWKIIDGWSFPIQFTFNFKNKQFDNDINYEGQYDGNFGPIKYKVSANDKKLTLDIQNYLSVKIHVEETNNSSAPDNTLSLKSVKNFISTIQGASGTATAQTYTLENNTENASKIDALAKQLKIPTSVISKIDFKVTNSSGHASIQPTVYFTKGVLMDYMSVKFKQNGTSGSVIAQANYINGGKIAVLQFSTIEASGVTMS